MHCRRTGSSWHNLAHALGIPRNILEAPITPKILKKLRKDQNIDDIKGLRMASQAYDEGSIPFTRSKKINNRDKKHFTSVQFLARNGILDGTERCQ